jgi:hypothetical protein
VIADNHNRGPKTLTPMVEGSWKTIELTVKMKIETEYLWPCRSRSWFRVVTEAEASMPESRRLRPAYINILSTYK